MNDDNGSHVTYLMLSHSTVKVSPSKKSSFFLVFSSKTQNMGPESQENGFEILKIAPEMPVLALQRWHGQDTGFLKVFGFSLISLPLDHLQRCVSTLQRALIQTKYPLKLIFFRF